MEKMFEKLNKLNKEINELNLKTLSMDSMILDKEWSLEKEVISFKKRNSHEENLDILVSTRFIDDFMEIKRMKCDYEMSKTDATTKYRDWVAQKLKIQSEIFMSNENTDIVE